MAQSSANIPASSTFTDLANGTVDLNGSQTAIRPIQELGILARNLVDPNADYEVIYDASTGNHVRVLATRASQASYLADWVWDTRAGSRR